MPNNFPKRKTIRLQNYNYSQEGMYFITICINNRIPLLMNKTSLNEYVINEFGKIIQNSWNELPKHNSGILLNEFTIMPDHIHGIIEITDGFRTRPYNGQYLSEIVRQLKTFSARKINELRKTKGQVVWQKSYYEHVIRNEKELIEIQQYIINNIQKLYYKP